MDPLATPFEPQSGLEDKLSQLNLQDSQSPSSPGAKSENSSGSKHRQRGSRGGGNTKKKETQPQPQGDYNPTALVVKNIHLGIERDSFLQAMAELGLPKPFAFNYYYEDGVFRGLAFINYHTPEDAQTVLNQLNGTELSGRKLKVEFKKYAPNSDKNFKPNNNVNPNPKANTVLNLEDPYIRSVFDQLSQFQANFQQQECYFPNDVPSTDASSQASLLEVLAHKLNLHYAIDPELNCIKLSKQENNKNVLSKYSRQHQMAEELRKKGSPQEKRNGGTSPATGKKSKEKLNPNSEQSSGEANGGGSSKTRAKHQSPNSLSTERFGRSPRNSQLLNSTGHTPGSVSPATTTTPPSRELEKTMSAQSREAPFLIGNKNQANAFGIVPIRQPRGPDLSQNFMSRRLVPGYGV